MKIAYLILAHNQFHHLERLVSSLIHVDDDIFIHVDKRAQLDGLRFRRPNVSIIEKRLCVHWGGFSMIKAQIELLKEANEKGHYDYYILLSGADYPIKTRDQLIRHLKENNGSNFLNAAEMPQFNKPLERIRTYYIEGGERTKSRIKSWWIKLCNYFYKKTIKNRSLPLPFLDYKLYAGGQWWAFHYEFIQYLLKFLGENTQFTKFFKHTYIPDEMFFHIILMNSPYSHTIKGCLTYTDWRIGEPPFPSLISSIHMAELEKEFSETAYGISYHCFARKFNDGSEDIIQWINRMTNSREVSTSYRR
ncbi:beta-1,6-N-acetylglucosaminyltransferase [Paenibacillus sp. LHD-117]|uniref:beta-1,6-N-acetylglucosaminyltransferase n=1 Tax=Paenibacillus sp. LHD-117 TaxID=3071412 RepID=UPI0027E1E1D1|nr:beta-1,6-N-acetylglucosaminyltransferase [Paenibacillus sp. LHD-117]MDQ6423255.1 beta-1,6-N-acetylglucosaminyltransferase [Paenibacillus sp. LHD-117]